ncbi:MAG TPA: peroxiredoxin [Alphaproteobacteria bacterium]
MAARGKNPPARKTAARTAPARRKTVKQAATKKTAKTTKAAKKKAAPKTARRPGAKAAAAPKPVTSRAAGPGVGDPAPDFTLPADGGATVRLSELRGRNVVLYFYPKDDTPGCTKEACGFNDMLPDFARLDAEVIGISRDNPASHDRFKQKYGLKFRLASDSETKVAQAYGTWIEKSNYGRTYMGMDRATFLIDRNGVIRGVWRRVKVPGHVEKVLEAAKAL